MTYSTDYFWYSFTRLFNNIRSLYTKHLKEFLKYRLYKVMVEELSSGLFSNIIQYTGLLLPVSLLMASIFSMESTVCLNRNTFIP